MHIQKTGNKIENKMIKIGEKKMRMEMENKGINSEALNGFYPLAKLNMPLNNYAFMT